MLIRSAHYEVGLSAGYQAREDGNGFALHAVYTENYRALGNIRKCLHTLYLLYHSDNHKTIQQQVN